MIREKAYQALLQPGRSMHRRATSSSKDPPDHFFNPTPCGDAAFSVWPDAICCVEELVCILPCCNWVPNPTEWEASIDIPAGLASDAGDGSVCREEKEPSCYPQTLHEVGVPVASQQ